MRKVLIVRHTERIDEVDGAAWEAIAAKHRGRGRRNFSAFLNDPHITNDGREIARTAASAVEMQLAILRDQGNHPPISRIYSSRLKRCVETAFEIAKLLNLPIFLSAGFSMTAAAVEMEEGNFEFAPLNELRNMCPGVELVDCDDPQSTHYLNWTTWRDVLEASTADHPITLVVAHRETIRNLMGFRASTPYCCIGEFDYFEKQASGEEQGEFQLSTLTDSAGRVLYARKKVEGSVA